MDISWFDWILFPLSYIYIFSVIGIATRIKINGKISGKTARKVVHIGVGVSIILIPLLFSSRILPTIIGISFIIITYITSPVSPIPRFKMSAFAEGHGLGTIYYSISLTSLIFLFFDDPWIIQVGFLPLVIGDAMASIAGVAYGKHSWKYIQSKTIEGSITGFISTYILLIVVLYFYSVIDKFDYPFRVILLLPLITAMLMSTVELISPTGLDNLTIPLSCTGIAILLDNSSFSPLI